MVILPARGDFGTDPGGRLAAMNRVEAGLKVPHASIGLADSDTVAVEFADAQSPDDEGTVGVFGLGPIGQMASRIAMHRGQRVIAVDIVPELYRIPEGERLAERLCSDLGDWRDAAAATAPSS